MMLPEMGTFSIQVRYSGSMVILELIGDLTNRAESLLSKFRERPRGLSKKDRVLILDFQHVPNISSEGIAILMRIVCERTERNLQTFACGLSAYLESLLRIVGLAQYVMIYPDEYAIVQRLKEAQG
jgi:anti-anti-sigma factor